MWRNFQPFRGSAPRCLIVMDFLLRALVSARGFFQRWQGLRMNCPFMPQNPTPPRCPDISGATRPTVEKVESAYKPGSVRLAARQSFLSARRRRLAPATYPGTTRAALSFPYLVLLRVGFTVPRGVSPARGALLPHLFTLTCALWRPSAVRFLLHWPSAHAAQALPGTLPCGARTFLDAHKARRDCPADSVGNCTGNREDRDFDSVAV